METVDSKDIKSGARALEILRAGGAIRAGVYTFRSEEELEHLKVELFDTLAYSDECSPSEKESFEAAARIISLIRMEKNSASHKQKHCQTEQKFYDHEKEHNNIIISLNGTNPVVL